MELTRLYLQMGIVDKDENTDAQAWLAEQDRMNWEEGEMALLVGAGVHDHCGRNRIDCCVAYHQRLVSRGPRFRRRLTNPPRGRQHA